MDPLDDATLRAALVRPYVNADGVSFDIRGVEVRHTEDEVQLTVTVRVTPEDGRAAGRWTVALDRYDIHEDLDGLRSAHALRELVLLVEAHLEEWWHTRGEERLADERGRRLD
ncbi:hypothetical protein [Streptomyces sp. ODS28]|uniref:hypothetical protein n=1 Tax=Streptomyces sp. ODS28 TaxID=3136688 RepID=UPI0031E81A8B